MPDTSITKTTKPRAKKNINKDLGDVWNMVLPNTIINPNTSSLQDDLSSGINSRLFEGLTGIMPNPDPVLKKLGWGKDVEAYKELMHDPQLYGAIENNRKPGVTSLLLDLSNENCPEEELTFFKGYFNSLINEGTYDIITNQTLNAPQFGRVVFGTVWGERDGYYVPIKITQMPYELFKYDYNGELLVPLDGAFFAKPEHPAKYFDLRHNPTLENPYGDPILSRCYWNVRFKKDGFKLWALFAEKFGMPLVKASYNAQALAKIFKVDPQSAANIILSQLSAMARDGVIVFPDGTNVDFAQAKTADTSAIYEKLIRICDEQNTKLQLGHSGATESTSGDKLSNDTTATDVRQHVVDSDKKYPVSFWNRIIYWIHQFNFSGTELPRFDLYAKEDVDQAQAARDATLVPVLQLSGQKLSASYLKKTYGFIDEDLEAWDVTQTQAPTFPQKSQSNNLLASPFSLVSTISPQNSTKQDTYPDQELIDAVADIAGTDTKPTDGLTEIVTNYLNKQSDFNTAMAKLAKLFPKMNTTELQDKMTRLLFAADILGRLSVKSELNIDIKEA